MPSIDEPNSAKPDPSPHSNSLEEPASPRLGLLLFAVYLLFYLLFVFISAFACDWFEVVLFGGLNLAVVYGFGLIVLALVLAMIYGGMRRSGA